MTPGRLLASRYELARPLGRGGMGEVWLGVDKVLGREVAVKIVDLDAASDPAAAERFRREGRAAAALAHENVVTVFDSGTDRSTAYLVMQLLPGPTLAELLQSGQPLPLHQAVGIAEQAAAALAAVHRIGIVHRDIKPANLMFSEDGRLKLVDFGIARLAESASAQLTAASTVVGSAAYMAPEQASGEPVTPATDLYSLGCVLMALLTGRPPFTAEHPLAVLQQHLSSPPPRVADLRSDVPPALEGLVDRLLAKAPAQRPADADLVREELATMRGSMPSATAVIPVGIAPTERLGRDAATRAMPPAAATPPASRSGSRRLAWRVLAPLAALLLIALLLPFAITSLTRPEAGVDEPSQPPAAETPAASAPAAPAPAEPEPAPAPAEPEPAPAQPASPAPADGFNALRAAIDAAAAAGQLGGEASEDLLERVGEVEERIAEGKTEDLPQRLRELSRRVDKHVRDEEITAEGAAAIQTAIEQLEQSLT